MRGYLLLLLLNPLSRSLRYRAGLKEAHILNKLMLADPDDKKHIIRLERTFEHRGHLCLVFESMRLAPVMISISI